MVATKRKRRLTTVQRERAARIREVVARVGSQRRLAKLLWDEPGKSNIVNEWCSGAKEPSWENYALMAERTGISLDGLVLGRVDALATPALRQPWQGIVVGFVEKLAEDPVRARLRRELHVDAQESLGADAAASIAFRRCLMPNAVYRVAQAEYVRVFREVVTTDAIAERTQLRRKVVGLEHQFGVGVVDESDAFPTRAQIRRENAEEAKKDAR